VEDTSGATVPFSLSSAMAQPAGPSQPGMVPTILGVLALHYLMALLVIQSGTRLYRLLLLPLAVGLPYHAASTYDVSGGDPEWQSHGYNFAVRAIQKALCVLNPARW
jgi:hypothetical protein